MSLSFIVMSIILLSFIPIFIQAKKNPQNAEKFSQTSVILGILGTFIGIAIGLMNFDTANIDSSITDLLDGLKVAFFTSIAGQITSLLINWTVKQPKDDLIDKDDIGIEDLYRALIDIKKGLVGDGDSTLITQIQKLRTSNHDNLSDIKMLFKEFAKEVAENNSKALIDALEEVMRDFNTKINEQFGENFKQLNDAVGKLLIWQEQYKDFVEESESILSNTIDVFNTSVLSLSDINKQITEIMSQVSIFQQASTSLESMITLNIGSIENLNKIAVQSQNLFPQLDSNLKHITNDIGKLIHSTSVEISNQADSVTTLYTNMHNNLSTLVEQTTQHIQNRITELDKELGDELNKALQSLGNQLASLSGKFVDDYSPLTEKLKNIIKMAEAI